MLLLKIQCLLSLLNSRNPLTKFNHTSFGDPYNKTTCLWTRGPKPRAKPLPKLIKTNEVEKGERVTFKSGKSQPKWYSDALAKAKNSEERRTLRSKTFPGIANAIAEQYTLYVLQEKSKK